jgi:DNA-binding winged helix-turn-helix (wHTH) protein
MLRESDIMKLPLITVRSQCKLMTHEDSPIVTEQAHPPAADAIIEFGRIRVLPRQRRLFADGVPVELGARAFDILIVLIEADGALVTKDELQRRVWPGIVVAQENLKVQVLALRRALGADRELVRTEHGRGYRFTAAVRKAVVARECLSTPDASTRQNGRTSASDLSVIASRLARLEVRLAEALNRLGEDGNNRRRRSRHHAGHSGRRARRHWRLHSVPGTPLESAR